MSDESHDSKNPILSAIGMVFIFLVPAALIVMLGVVGAAFLGGSNMKTADDEKEATEATVASAPAAPADSGASGPAPASGDSASEGSSDEGAETETETASTDAAASSGEEASAGGAETASASAGGGAEIDPAMMEMGKKAYATCAACHGPDGQGLKAGPMLMAPSLTGSELLLGDPDEALLIVLKGIAKENMDYMGMMASLGAALDDEKMAAVLTYTRNAFGNSAPPVTVEQAAEAREKFQDVNAPAGVKRAEIPQIVEEHEEG